MRPAAVGKASRAAETISQQLNNRMIIVRGARVLKDSVGLVPIRLLHLMTVLTRKNKVRGRLREVWKDA